jgi:hypothetical protein
MRIAFILVAAFLALALAGPARAAEDFKVGDRLAKPKPAEAKAEFKVTDWESLVPKDWDPMKEFKDTNFALLPDGDPRATELLLKMQHAWEKAPIEPSLDGAHIRIAGFLVPIEEAKGLISEFLLVPYFGACIHVPPPPANQIIHVVADRPVKGFHMMQPVWVNGVLTTVRSETRAGMGMASAGYRMAAQAVEPYKR